MNDIPEVTYLAGESPDNLETIDLVDSGLLWLVNRVVFHPRGFALALNPATGEFSLLGDGSEVWAFATDDDDAKFAACERTLGERR